MDHALTLIATTPDELHDAHAAMLTWCDQQIAACEADRREAEDLLGLANEGVLALPPAVNTRRQLAVRRIAFYRKIRLALDAGYYIVPNFPMDVIAIRTEAVKPKSRPREHDTQHHTLECQMLPVGEGRWVSPHPELRSWTVQKPPRPQFNETVTRTVTMYAASKFADPVFPIALVKPEILARGQQALAAKFFDEVGICRDWPSGGDPILVGRIRNPRRGMAAATFFLAWWVDTRRL